MLEKWTYGAHMDFYDHYDNNYDDVFDHYDDAL